MKAARLLLVVPVALSLCQCAVDDARVSSLLVSPAGEQYVLYTCPRLIEFMRGTKTNEKELQSQIANAGAFGSVVGGYKLDYANQHGNFVAARNAAREKKCEIPADVVVDEPL